MIRRHALLVTAAALSAACTAYHSRQALFDPTALPPADDARFVVEEDAGFALLGVLVLSEPDHHAVLMERARRRHGCARLSHAELEFFTDHWVLVGFPVARITALCEPAPPPLATPPSSSSAGGEARPVTGDVPPDAPAPATEPAVTAEDTGSGGER